MALLALPLLAAPQTLQGHHVLVTFPVLMAPQNAEGPPGRPGPVTPLRREGLAPLFLRRHFVALIRDLCGIPQDGFFFPYHFEKNRFNF